MNPAVIVVPTEELQLPFEIPGTPKRDPIQQLSTYGTDQSLNERSDSGTCGTVLISLTSRMR